MFKLLLVVLALAVFLVSLAVLQWPRPGITLRNYHRIQEGMTEQAVAELMGAPPHRDGREPSCGGYIPLLRIDQRAWIMDNNREIWITINEGRVVEKHVWEGLPRWEPTQRGPLESLCARLGI